MTCLRLSFAVPLALTLVLPDVAFARRAGGETPAAVGPAAPVVAAPAPAPAPAVAAPAPTVAPAAPAPAWEAPAAAPVVAAPVVIAPMPAATSVPPPRPVASPPKRLRGGNAMILAGGVSFGVFYVFTSLAGAVAIDKARDMDDDPLTGKPTDAEERRRNYGRGLLIPVAGPFIAMAYTDSARQRWGAALTGTVQAAGVVLVLAGMVRNGRARRWERVQLGGGYAPGGATVSLSGRF